MSYSWRKGGQSNGGYCNAIAVDPHDPNRAVACGDVWGFAATTDGGNNWYPCNLGHSGTSNRPYGRCAVFSKKTPGLCYVGVGTLKYKNPTGGGYLGAISFDDPYKLNTVNKDVSFTSYLPTGGAGDLPRPVGKLLCVDYDETFDKEYLYALTRQGLMGSTDGGRTMHALGLDAPAPLYAWSAIELLPSGKLLVSSFRTSRTGGSRLWMVTNPRSDKPTITEVTGIHGLPGVIEDITSTIIGGKITNLLACGPYGLRAYNGKDYGGFGTDVHLSSVVQGPSGTIWVGNGIGSSKHQLVAKCPPGGTFHWVTDAAACGDLIAGTDRRYWLADAWSFMGKGKGFSVSQLAADPMFATEVYIAGRSGVHQTRDGGVTWEPCCNGLDGSESNDIVIGPNPGEAWASDTDYKWSYTRDYWVNAEQRDTVPAGSTGRSLVALTSDGAVVEVKGTQILVAGKDEADDFARSALLNPKDVAVTPEGHIYISLSGGVLVGDPA